jgi:hypothetical protein
VARNESNELAIALAWVDKPTNGNSNTTYASWVRSYTFVSSMSDMEISRYLQIQGAHVATAKEKGQPRGQPLGCGR